MPSPESRLNPCSLFDRAGVERHRKDLKLDPAVVREYRNHFCKRFCDSSSAHTDLKRRLTTQFLQLHQRCDSKVDGATKLLFKNADGLILESVVLRFESGRTSLCVSSQVGCAAACRFCATGKMGIARNLSLHEVLDQVLQAGQLLALESQRIRNIVFMGMGEPFHNESTLHEAIDRLCSPDYFDFPQSRIMVSSVGVLDGMLRLAQRFPRVHQALSLHSVRQDVRQRLIPTAVRYSVDQLRLGIEQLNSIQDCPLLIEYLMLGGVNDSDDDARELVEWTRGLNTHINLIPYNPIEGADELRPSTRVLEFSRQLKDAGRTVTTRKSLGRDIAAACGQLVQSENRRIAREIHQLELRKS